MTIDQENLPIASNQDMESIKSAKEEQIKSAEEHSEEAPVQTTGQEEVENPQEEVEASNPAQNMSLEEADDLFAAGLQAFALSNYEEAAEKLALTVEIQ